MKAPGRFGLFLALVTCLGAIAWLSPRPGRVTDRDVYEATAARRIVPDCSDLHCFRVLVAWTIGTLPGQSPEWSAVKWKAYAVLANALAAVAVLTLSLSLGLSHRAARLAATASAFGFGSLYTLHDAFTSDPLMFFLGPWLTCELLAGRSALAGVVASFGVLAKEFAAAPLYIFAAFAAAERRWAAAARALVGGNAAFIVWLLFTLALMLKLNYSYGGTDSANFASGAGLAPWIEQQSARGIAAAMFNEFGALYVLAPAGFLVAPRSLRTLAIAALPAAAVFAYVQQPDRALWNFHFVATPMSALALERSSPALAWATVAAFGIGNLRVGAQLPIATAGRIAIIASVVMAAVSAATALRREHGLTLAVPQ